MALDTSGALSAGEPNMIDSSELTDDIRRHLTTSFGSDTINATIYDWRMALSLALRDRITATWLAASAQTRNAKAKRVHYLSMEFLTGRLIKDVITNLRIEEPTRLALTSLGQAYEDLITDEPDAALGNGGLGRLAACLMDSLASLAIPAIGYGIRYEHGLFEQHFHDGQQIESAETWLERRYAWEFARPDISYPIHFGGYTASIDGRVQWHSADTVYATAYDTPIIGWRAKWANTLRLWAAKPAKPLDLSCFNRGDYLAASAAENLARTLSRVLYPEDSTEIGKELRLKQEYFFTAASIQDVVRRCLIEGHQLEQLADCAAIQLNDTHPAIAGPELTRLLVDSHGFAIDHALDITSACLGFTNHTLLPEALECWPVDLFARILPRHYEIIHQIQTISKKNHNRPLTVIANGAVHMGELAFVMAHKVNGVSQLHTDLIKATVFANLHQAYPTKIINQTNGVTPRRWLYSCNPPLRTLLNDTIGETWIDDLEELAQLRAYADNPSFCDEFQAAKALNKQKLQQWLRSEHGVELDPTAFLDVQIKRIHEYKRQLLNILATIALWNEIKEQPSGLWVPRVKIFAGKAAPSYMMAKLIIRLIHDVAKTINADTSTAEILRILFLRNYNVSMAEILIPAADLSEQISTAGMEASGTGNMKFALNGAPTIGTLDGANVEIRDRVGIDNFFLFGLTAKQAAQRRQEPNYARSAIQASPRLHRVLAQIAEGVFCPNDPERYQGLINALYEHDPFLVTCDFESYYETSQQVEEVYGDRSRWAQIAVSNTAGMGWFSSDRTVQGYANDIWSVKSLHKISQTGVDQKA